MISSDWLTDMSLPSPVCASLRSAKAAFQAISRTYSYLSPDLWHQAKFTKSPYQVRDADNMQMRVRDGSSLFLCADVRSRLLAALCACLAVVQEFTDFLRDSKNNKAYSKKTEY